MVMTSLDWLTTYLTGTYLNTHYDRPRSVRTDEHVYEVVGPVDVVDGNVYENVGDQPLHVQQHYENFNFEEPYDVPRSRPAAIYDRPINRTGLGSGSGLGLGSADNAVYDYPKGLIPLSARLLLNARKDQGQEHPSSVIGNCHMTSLLFMTFLALIMLNEQSIIIDVLLIDIHLLIWFHC